MSETAIREWRRHRAWELKQAGWKQQDIAQALGVSEGAVSHWCQAARSGGDQALDAKPRPGVPSKLTAEQKADVVELLTQGAETHGYAGAVWTTARVADLIERHFGVHYHPATMSDLLRELGWSLQKPVVRASQRNEQAIRDWYATRFPAIKKK